MIYEGHDVSDVTEIYNSEDECYMVGKTIEKVYSGNGVFILEFSDGARLEVSGLCECGKEPWIMPDAFFSKAFLKEFWGDNYSEEPV